MSFEGNYNVLLWEFIEKYYPNYFSCDDVLLSDILVRKLNGEKICDNDEKHIKDWNIKKELLELEQKLLKESFKNYFEIIYSPRSTARILSRR